MKKTSKKGFFSRNFKIKGIFSGLFFAIISFATVFAFMINTDVDSAIQYIQQTFYTDSGGNGGNVLIHVGSGNNNDDIWLNGQVEAEAYCDRNGQNCKESENIITGDNIIAGNIPAILGRTLIESNIYNSGGIVMIDESDPTDVSLPGVKFYVNGNSLFNGDGYFQGNITGNNGVYSNNYIYSSGGYCDYSGNCHQITDFYTKDYIDNIVTANFYATGLSFNTGNGNLTIQMSGTSDIVENLDGRYITGYTETDPIWTAASGNYFTSGYVSGHFQDDIASTSCQYGISGVADDGTVSCAVNNDTNYYATGLSFNTGNGVLTIQMSGTSDIMENLDGRYLQGNGTNKHLAKWNGNKLVDSIIVENGGNIGIGTNNPKAKLDVIGNVTEGEGTIAKGHYSHAEGEKTIAEGDYSHAEGEGTIAKGDYQHVQGKFNIPDSTSLMIIGNGINNNNRSNIMTVKTDRVEINGPLDLADNGKVAIGGTCSIAGRIVFDATNKNFVGCDGTIRVKLNN